MLEQNPYHPLSPPDDPTLFYGRQQAAAFLRQHLVGAHNRELIVISGRIGMGKTALLNQVAYFVDERYISLHFQLTSASVQDTASLLINLAEAIVACMEAVGASTYRLPPIPEPGLEDVDLRHWFVHDFLDVALTAIRRDRFLLLLLDDLQVLFKAMDDGQITGEFIDYLGELLDQHDRLDIVAAIDGAYEKRLLNYARTGNINLHYRLQPFDEAAARQLIIEPVENVYQYTDETIAKILSLCGGYPFLLHSVCRLIYRYRENSPGVRFITPDMIDAVYTAVLEETGEVMEDFWQQATPNMKHVLHLLLEFRHQNPDSPVPLATLKSAARRVKLNETQLLSALRQLEYEYIVTASMDGDYAFSTGLEADWFAAGQTEADTDSKTGTPDIARIAAGIAVIAAVIVMGLLMAFGVFATDEEAEPDENAPPTATLDLDIGATRQAEDNLATGEAIPSSTTTPSPTNTASPTRQPTDTPSETPTPTASETSTPTRTPSATDTGTPSRTPRPSPTGIPTQTLSPTRAAWWFAD